MNGQKNIKSSGVHFLKPLFLISLITLIFLSIGILSPCSDAKTPIPKPSKTETPKITVTPTPTVTPTVTPTPSPTPTPTVTPPPPTPTPSSKFFDAEVGNGIVMMGIIMIIGLLIFILLIMMHTFKRLKAHLDDSFKELVAGESREFEALFNAINAIKNSSQTSGSGTKNANDVVTKLEQEKSDLLEVIENLKSELKSSSGNRSNVASSAGSGSGETNPERFIQRLINDYNNAIQDSQYEQVFIERYKPMRLGASNVMNIKKGIDTEYKFERLPQGDYFAIEFSSNTYLVIPRFIVYQDSYHESGGMGLVFKCIGYEPQKYYHSMKLLKPAKFSLINGSNWRLIEQGQLQLGRPE